jgi:hypothetical protein
MSTIGFGKTIEGVQLNTAVNGKRFVAATVYYNGISITTSSGMIDTQNYDDAIIRICAGTLQGALLTVTNAVYEADTNNPAAATLVTGASFTDLTSASTAGLAQVGAIKVKDTKRFICLRTELQGSPITVDFDAQIILGKATSQAVAVTLAFDL